MMGQRSSLCAARSLSQFKVTERKIKGRDVKTPGCLFHNHINEELTQGHRIQPVTWIYTLPLKTIDVKKGTVPASELRWFSWNLSVAGDDEQDQEMIVYMNTNIPLLSGLSPVLFRRVIH